MAHWVTLFLCPLLETFWTQPQFRLTVLEPDDEEEEEEGPWEGWGAAGVRGPALGGTHPQMHCAPVIHPAQPAAPEGPGPHVPDRGLPRVPGGTPGWKRQWGNTEAWRYRRPKAGSEWVEDGG